MFPSKIPSLPPSLSLSLSLSLSTRYWLAIARAPHLPIISISASFFRVNDKIKCICRWRGVYRRPKSDMSAEPRKSGRGKETSGICWRRSGNWCGIWARQFLNSANFAVRIRIRRRTQRIAISRAVSRLRVQNAPREMDLISLTIAIC
jgi:hypothetical protein